MIIRVEHRDHYTVVRNNSVRDSRLSFRATGILTYLLSLPDDTPLSREHLADVKQDGIRSVRAGLQELAEAGYIKYQKTQDAHGHWRTEATVYECPTEGAKRATGKGHEPKARKPTVGEPTIGNRAAIRSNKEGAASSTPPPPPEYLCAACGAEARYMRPDESWWCQEHYRTIRVVGS
ncbi:MAG: hypothetical protein AB1679_10780 [Actinomycetota bacterium]